jgi:hypothetical protein
MRQILFASHFKVDSDEQLNFAAGYTNLACKILGFILVSGIDTTQVLSKRCNLGLI